jgi:hypothetical protein
MATDNIVTFSSESIIHKIRLDFGQRFVVAFGKTIIFYRINVRTVETVLSSMEANIVEPLSLPIFPRMKMVFPTERRNCFKNFLRSNQYHTILA